ncbi:MAG: methyltransferase domain-containing protein, partial [Elusimicrobia bacterium]|nr:methyltransferase domain-containing protein [Elusimicrobiota bacterium]
MPTTRAQTPARRSSAAARIYREIDRCRICGNPDLAPLLHLGEQALTGLFPRRREQEVPGGPLELVKCREDEAGETCGLVQLRQSYDKPTLYGKEYGYRSGLNLSMVKHLHGKVQRILGLVAVGKGDLVVDIGSNDSTLLQAYPAEGPTLLGIDPTGKKFRRFYPPHIRLVPDFFSAAAVRREVGERKAKVVTSISMFYDLEAPLDFAREVASVLADDGVWVLEQSYLGTMLAANAYDTICHEHLEYYALRQIDWVARRAGLKVIEVEFNLVNGGSFSVTLAKETASHRAGEEAVRRLLARERRVGLHTLAPYAAFKRRVLQHRDRLIAFVERARKRGERVYGYGASTKGNVVLQFCGFTSRDIAAIAEVNEDKFGSFPPGTKIPIVSVAQARTARPDYFLV